MSALKQIYTNHFKRRMGDRNDGWRVRKIDPFFRMIPYFLRTRTDSQNLYEERVPIAQIEEFIKAHRDEMPGLSIMHVVMAAIVRLYSQRPYLNRFVVWNKIFARNNMSIALTIKRSMTDEGEETLIKPYFQLNDTLYDVVRRVNDELQATQQVGAENTADTISRIFSKMPDWLLRFVVWMLIWLDKVGLIPRVLNEVSPWHSSVFLTNIGSIGVESIYHHLYEFGTCSMFVAMGKKTRRHHIGRDGEVEANKSILLKFVMDERVCDGYYYALSMRMLNKILTSPEQLLTPPEQVVKDNGVRR